MSAAVEQLQIEHAELTDRLARVTAALEVLGAPPAAARAPGWAPLWPEQPPAPPATHTKARPPKAVPTPHDKAIAKPRAPHRTKAGGEAQGANAALRGRLEALVIAAGAPGIKTPVAAQRVGVSRVVALRQLRHLEADGKVHLTGWSHSARWFAGKKARGLQRGE